MAGMNSSRVVAAIASEPYRLLFPLGVGAGLIGVALWPLWLAGWIEFYPGLAHVRIMIEGFFGAFIFGFLGTAGPRMLEVPSFSWRFWAGAVAVWIGAQLASLQNAHDWAEAGFIVVLAMLLTGMAKRFPQRAGLPPPGFLLVLISLVLAIPAALTQMPLLHQWVAGLPVIVPLAGRAFLVEGFVLLPILGVAPFFLGRFGGLPPRHLPGDIRTADALWRRRALACGGLGLVLAVAIIAKAVGWPRVGAAFQAAITAGFVWTQVPFRYRKPVPTIGRLAQIALICLVLAPLLEAFWPGERLAWRHLLVIPGFQFVLATVGTWVIFAHAGHRERCARRWPALGIIGGLWLTAAICRMAAETSSAIYNSHLVYAAILWIAASLWWLCLLLPRLREEG